MENQNEMENENFCVRCEKFVEEELDSGYCKVCSNIEYNELCEDVMSTFNKETEIIRNDILFINKKWASLAKKYNLYYESQFDGRWVRMNKAQIIAYLFKYIDN